MKCRVIEDEPGRFEAEVRQAFMWNSIRSYAVQHKHMRSEPFEYTYDSQQEAEAALVLFSEELRNAKKRRRKVHVKGNVNDIEFIGKI